MHDLLIVGAGPYGLSIAAHAAAAGLDVRVFGDPMASWRDHMPRGMFLKSEPWASNLSAPDGRFGLDAYCALQGTTARHGEPLPVETFSAYGLWFARRAVPPVDERMVESVDSCPGGFDLRTQDGELFRTRTVALAVGVLPFAEIPMALRGLDPAYVTHSSHHSDLTRFRDQDVTVVGAGQAALETAALLSEQGTRVRIVARSHDLAWNTLPPPWERPWWQSLRAPHSGLGCGWRNWFYSELPGAFRRLPHRTRARVCATALGPAGAWWVRDRVTDRFDIHLGQEIRHAKPWGGRLRITTSETGAGSWADLPPFETDHVIAATGFRATYGRMGMLAPALRAGLGADPHATPRVGSGFESRRPGLFLAGLMTAADFGPSMRFVHGASFTAPHLVDGVRRRLRGGRPSGGLTLPGSRSAHDPLTAAER
ncbi:NAD(P)-binding domain-containing protein [Streptomyces sp. NPDC048641]|uniref:NAD(P)-binding domain-containing protein n=1 Tax=Streptomyces sp. NPDC048641 TaxID=3154825 RepID=UPI0034130EBE